MNTLKIETEVVRLQLKQMWTTTMASSQYRDNLHLKCTRNSITGIGEAAPILRYSESALGAAKVIETLHEELRNLKVQSVSVQNIEVELKKIFDKVEGQLAAKAAIDIAILDWLGQYHQMSLSKLLGIEESGFPVTSFSIGIDTPEVTKQKVLAAESFPILKIKVGLNTDEETISAVRSVTKKPIRVDANEGWKSKEEAVRKINWLESQGVELVEQPLPAAMLEETQWVRSRVHIPIFADEACVHETDIRKLQSSYDGVNIKLMKCGGLLAARRMIELAKSLKLKTMIGCMIESSIGITAAATLAALVDYADLDGNLLISNDPYLGVTADQGRLKLNGKPGLGLSPRAV